MCFVADGSLIFAPDHLRLQRHVLGGKSQFPTDTAREQNRRRADLHADRLALAQQLRFLRLVREQHMQEDVLCPRRWRLDLDPPAVGRLAQGALDLVERLAGVGVAFDLLDLRRFRQERANDQLALAVLDVAAAPSNLGSNRLCSSHVFSYSALVPMTRSKMTNVPGRRKTICRIQSPSFEAA